MTPEDKTVNDLAAQWWPLAVKTAGRCARRWNVPELRDEFESAAGEAILRGARAWLARGNRKPVAAFVVKAVWWACFKLYRAEMERPFAARLDAPHRDCDELGTFGALLAGREREPLDELLAAEGRTLGGALDRLRAREREALERHALDGELFTAIGATWGVSYQRAQQLYAEAVRKLAALPALNRDRVPA